MSRTGNETFTYPTRLRGLAFHVGSDSIRPRPVPISVIVVVVRVLRAIGFQIEYWWKAGFRPRLEGLTDEEFLWAPVPDCWTIHPLDNGNVRYDHAWPPPHPAPFTTIAWRLCHIGVGCLANRATRLYPSFAPEPIDRRMWEGPVPFPSTAAGALEFLDTWWDAWFSGLLAAGEEGLWELIGDREWDIPEMQLGTNDPVIGLVLHVHREVMHHGAEVCLLRDLYGHSSSKPA